MTMKEAARDTTFWDGMISASDFLLAAYAFSEKWKMFNPSLPPWVWVPCKKHHLIASNQAEGYLSLEKMCLLKSSEVLLQHEESRSGNQIVAEENSSSEEEEPLDYATFVQSNSQEAHHYIFHIIYSASYRVPVLYFRAHHSDGQPLMLGEIESALPIQSTRLLLESKWTFITQEEHPYLNMPWYKLHPCGTSEWMKLLFHCDTSLSLTNNNVRTELYLSSWFSVVGQVVGLGLPLEILHCDF